MFHPDSRFDHHAFVDSSNWAASRDMVRIANVDLLRREITGWGVAGAVAELGVGVGTFAVMINRYFADRRIYLFDTYVGFDASDLAAEASRPARRALRCDRVTPAGGPVPVAASGERRVSCRLVSGLGRGLRG
jgi:hypothetical protein